MREIKEQLRQMKTRGRWNPDAGFVMRGKEALSHAIQASRRADVEAPVRPGMFHRLQVLSHLLLPGGMRGALRPVVAVCAIGFFAISGWIATVSAAYNSVPGDALYGVKLAAEKTQAAVVSVTGSGSEKAQLHLEFATRRAHEVRQVLAKEENNATVKQQAVSLAIDSLEHSIAVAKDSVSESSKTEPGQSVAVARNVNDKSPEIVSALQEASKESVATGNAALAKKVAETTKLVNDTAIAAVEAAVQTQTTGNSAVKQQEVKDMVVKQIETVAQDTKATGDVVANVQTIASLATSTAVMMVSSTVISTSVVSTTVSAAIATTTPTGMTAISTAQKVAETTAVAQGAIAEAKNLADNNQLLEALQQVKKASQATQEVKQVVVDARVAAQAVGESPPAGVKGEKTVNSASTSTVSATEIKK